MNLSYAFVISFQVEDDVLSQQIELYRHRMKEVEARRQQQQQQQQQRGQDHVEMKKIQEQHY